MKRRITMHLTGPFVLAWGLVCVPAGAQTSTGADPPVRYASLFLLSDGSSGEPATASTAEKEPSPWEKGSVNLGGLYAFLDSTVSFGRANAPGVNINPEQQLGLDSSMLVFRADGLYRPGESRRNQLDFSYDGFHRSGDATFSTDITIGNITYPAGAQAHTVFDIDLLQANYSYAFIQGQHARVGAGMGLYAIPLKYEVDVTTSGGRTAFKGADTTLPLPALAARAEFRVLRKLYLNTSVDGFYLDVSDFRGWLVDLDVEVEYRPWRRVGLGVGYNYTDLGLDVKNAQSSYPGANFVGSVDFRFSGLFFYGKVLF